MLILLGYFKKSCTFSLRRNEPDTVVMLSQKGVLRFKFEKLLF